MNTAFGDFAQLALHANNDNKVDMTFKCNLDLSHFCEQKASINIENYKKQCNFQERVVLLYFIKALSAYQAAIKMLSLQSKHGSIVNHRVDSDIVTKKELSNYINEIHNSFFEAVLSLELITLEMNCDVNSIFLKIVHNSENEFESNMIKISENEGVKLWLIN